MRKHLRFLALALLGATFFAIPQLYLFTRSKSHRDWQGENMAWFLNSASAIGVIMVTLALGALTTALLTKGRVIAIAKPLVLGAVFASIVVLLFIGAGEMWPLVVIQCALLCALAVLLGAGLGSGIRTLVTRAAGR